MAKGSCFGHKPHFNTQPLQHLLTIVLIREHFYFLLPKKEVAILALLCALPFPDKTQTPHIASHSTASPQSSGLSPLSENPVPVTSAWEEKAGRSEEPARSFYKCNFYTYIYCVCVRLGVNMPCLIRGEDSLCELVLSLPGGIQGMYM